MVSENHDAQFSSIAKVVSEGSARRTLDRQGDSTSGTKGGWEVSGFHYSRHRKGLYMLFAPFQISETNQSESKLPE